VWALTFEDRLARWVETRQLCATLPLDQCCLTINDWWQQLPISTSHLCVNNVEAWPDPWELLATNVYCNVAKSLGIVYTIMLMNREDINTCKVIDTDLGVLVDINNGQYILNYALHYLLNTHQTQVLTYSSIDSTLLKHKIN
jgi:hypothetical protein